MSNKFKLVVFVPQDHLEKVRMAVCGAGAGRIGNYDNCTFMSSGIGTFRPLAGASPAVGEVGRLERVGEARLEVTVEDAFLSEAIKAMKRVHPYEEPAYDIIRLEDVTEG